jgi:tetratricopeptide (TPR) repeat protein
MDPGSALAYRAQERAAEITLQNLGNPNQSLKRWIRLLEAKPHQPEGMRAAERMAEVYQWHLGLWEQSLTMWDRLLETTWDPSPSKTETQRWILGKAEALYQTMNFHAAQQVLELLPSPVLAQYLVKYDFLRSEIAFGQCQKEAAKCPQAIEIISNFIRSHPKSDLRFGLDLNLASCYEALNQEEKALKHLREIQARNEGPYAHLLERRILHLDGRVHRKNPTRGK